MVKLLALALMSAFIAGSFQNPVEPKTTDEMIDYINSLDTTWKAGKNFDDSYTEEHIKQLMGVLPKPVDYKPRKARSIGKNVEDFPKAFDTREKFGKICPQISEVKDQGACGSDWAIATTTAMSDRHCIHTEGKEQLEISAQYMMACCSYCVDEPGEGCKGGHPESVWDYYFNYGAVSGGYYNSKKGCQPYLVEPCEHHEAHGTLKKCPKNVVTAPKCSGSCAENYNKTIENDKQHLRGEMYHTYMNQIPEVMTELMENGPIVAQFEAFQDFVLYKSGIYDYKSGGSLGLHAVKVVGWGEENGIPYWVALDSFNSDWGDHGQFKIRRDVDVCGFNSGMSAGKPRPQ